MTVGMQTKMFKCQKTIIQALKKVIKKFLTFFLVKILVMNGDLKNRKTDCFIQKQPTRISVTTKISVLEKPIQECSFSALMVKNLEKYV